MKEVIVSKRRRNVPLLTGVLLSVIFYAACNNGRQEVPVITEADSAVNGKGTAGLPSGQVVHTQLLRYRNQKDLLEILAVLPDSVFTSWEWKQESRKQMVDFMRTYDDIGDTQSLPFSNINSVTPALLNIQVVDGIWKLALYKAADGSYIVITDDIAGDGNDMKVFEYKDGALIHKPLTAVFGDYLAELLTDKNSKACQEYITDHELVFTWNFRKNDIVISAASLTDEDAKHCLKGNRMQLLFDREKKRFSLAELTWMN